MSDLAPKRRWSFSLRALFVAVTLAAILTWLGIELTWLRERRQIAAILKFEPNGSVRAPGISWLFGEKGYAFILVTVRPAVGTSDMTIANAGMEKLRRLFPEAEITAQEQEPKPWFLT